MRAGRQVFGPLKTLLILVAANAYIALRVIADLPVTTLWKFAGLLLLVSITVLMRAGLGARSHVAQPWADRLTWIGMICMGLFSSLFVFTLVRDVLLLLSWWFIPQVHRAEVLNMSAIGALGAALAASFLGFINARRRARIVRVDVPVASLPVALDGFTIVQVSDLHVGPTIKRGYVQNIVDAVNDLEPHVIALTGDFVDGSVRDLAPHVAPLAELRARHGVYMVLGNHEYYAGERDWMREFQRLGIRVLMNEHIVLELGSSQLVLAGVTDFSAHHFNREHRSDPAAAIRNSPATAALRILLAHQPRSAPAAAEAGFDLQLSGHTHGGQFWPWNHFVRFQQPFTAGMHRIGKLRVYVSRGTGYWGPPKRFGAPSEITRIRLRRAP